MFNTSHFLLEQLAIGTVIGAASGAIGSFILIRRMALVGDALSHVALPGIALAIALHVDPFWGVIITLLGAAGMIWWLELQTRLPVDTLVGILFTASLAIGILAIPDTEMFESLFGAFPSMSRTVFLLVSGTAIIMLAGTLLLAPRFLYSIVSEDLARIGGVGRGYELVLLVIFSVIVGLGIKLVGTLLMGALTIIPAAAARNVTVSMKSYLLMAILFGVCITAAGVLVAAYWKIPPGPVIILCGVMLFMLSLPIAWLRHRE